MDASVIAPLVIIGIVLWVALEIGNRRRASGGPDPLARWGAGVATGPPPPILTRIYHGDLAQANALFMQDAAALGQYGYVPIAQAYAQGSWGCAAFLLALLLCVVLIGILVFIYLLVVKPDGALTVTYQLRAPYAPAPA